MKKTLLIWWIALAVAIAVVVSYKPTSQERFATQSVQFNRPNGWWAQMGTSSTRSLSLQKNAQMNPWSAVIPNNAQNAPQNPRTNPIPPTNTSPTSVNTPTAPTTPPTKQPPVPPTNTPTPPVKTPTPTNGSSSPNDVKYFAYWMPVNGWSRNTVLINGIACADNTNDAVWDIVVDSVWDIFQRIEFKEVQSANNCKCVHNSLSLPNPQRSLKPFIKVKNEWISYDDLYVQQTFCPEWLFISETQNIDLLWQCDPIVEAFWLWMSPTSIQRSVLLSDFKHMCTLKDPGNTQWSAWVWNNNWWLTQVWDDSTYWVVPTARTLSQ